ncbi:MAG TPA: fumarylacetoacetate hydrolase family protein [Planctomycetota bacterium]|nr:fumarylacetoacetate hydrolase family protein [Planctomycetota bacterium]
MRLCTFTFRGETTAGVIDDDDKVVDLRGGPPGPAPRREFKDLLDALVQMGQDSLLMLARMMLAIPHDDAPPLSEVRLEAPIPRPVAITAVGLNYKDHAKEQGKETPAIPMLFSKHPLAVNRHEADIPIPPGRDHIDYEAELAFVIGTGCERVSQAGALEHVLGYTVLNDTTDRKAQKEDGQFHRAKSYKGFAPMGPWLVTADALSPDDLAIRCRVNGEERQSSRTSQLIFSVPFLVEYLSAIHPLVPGDVISTGTPGGVGVFREPKVFLRDGDVVECEVEGIGVLRSRLVAPRD